jgi:hypothetical protein
LPVAGEVHPAVFVTVKVYIPGFNSDTVVLVPVPVKFIFPGDRVSFHVPVDGNPLKVTLPVDAAHVGWEMASTTGVEGRAFTVRVNVVDAASQGAPSGL